VVVSVWGFDVEEEGEGRGCVETIDDFVGYFEMAARDLIGIKGVVLKYVSIITGSKWELVRYG
jgi:hypothetical protein